MMTAAAASVGKRECPQGMWGWTVEEPLYHIARSRILELRSSVDDAGDDFYSALVQAYPSAATCSQSKLEELALMLLRDRPDLLMVKQLSKKPDWIDQQTLDLGVDVFLQYSFPSLLSLLYFSLLGGFSAPLITRVLDETGYLTKSSKDAIWRRLNETLDMVVRCMGSGAMEPDGDGFRAALRVRMVHCRVRHRLLQKGWAKGDSDGLPLNVEDMLATLLSFSSNVLHTIKSSCGAPLLSRRQETAYLHLWRYIGYCLGLPEAQLVHLASPEAARGATESLALHLLHPNARSCEIANNILGAISDRPPMRWSLGMHSAVARTLLGAPLSDALKIPSPGLLVRLASALLFVALRLLNVIIPCLYSPEVGRRVRARLRFAVDRALASVPSSQKEASGRCPFAG